MKPGNVGDNGGIIDKEPENVQAPSQPLDSNADVTDGDEGRRIGVEFSENQRCSLA